jgi:hypothetical protein
MCQLSGMTRAQLDKLTKEQLIQLALEGVIIETIAGSEFDKKTGELISLKTINSDAYTGIVSEIKEIKKTFYETGAIDIISVKTTDGGGKVLDAYDIKHARDDKTQPVKVGAGGTVKEVITIEGQPMSFVVEIVTDTPANTVPTVTLFGLEIPIMSERLWSVFAK